MPVSELGNLVTHLDENTSGIHKSHWRLKDGASQSSMPTDGHSLRHFPPPHRGVLLCRTPQQSRYQSAVPHASISYQGMGASEKHGVTQTNGRFAFALYKRDQKSSKRIDGGGGDRSEWGHSQDSKPSMARSTDVVPLLENGQRAGTHRLNLLVASLVVRHEEIRVGKALLLFEGLDLATEILPFALRFVEVVPLFG